MDLRNAKLPSGSDLFPADVLEKDVEKSSKVLHDETIQKAVSCDKPASRGRSCISPNLRVSSSNLSSSSPSGH